MKDIYKPNIKKNFTRRIYALVGVFLLILILLVLKIGYIQVVKEDYYQKFAQGQVEQRVPIRATRGLIYDRNGELIVDNRRGYSVFIIPAYFPKNKIKREKLIKYLASTLNITINDIKNKIEIKDRYLQNKYTPVLLKRDINSNIAFILKENEDYFEGVEVNVIPMRRYLMGNNLAHILGYTGIIDSKTWSAYKKIYSDENPYEDKNIAIGKRGLEKGMDLQLRGKDGVAVRLVDSRGKPIDANVDSREKLIIESKSVIKKPFGGKQIYLTIDKKLQSVAKDSLNGKRGVVIISKPSNGEILALVSNPSFDPKIFIKRQARLIKELDERPDTPWFNRAINGAYAPSSVFKLVVALAALDGKGINPNKKFNCTGMVAAGNRYFRCHAIHGRLNMIQAIRDSCNSYFYQLGDEIGWNIIYKYATMFNLTKPYELFKGMRITGFVPNAKLKKKNYNEPWYKGDTFNHSIGQGYTLLPPLKVHNIISAIAGDGVLYKLKLIKKIVGPNNKEGTIEPKPILLQKKFISDSTLKTLKQAVLSVVTHGTASYYGKFSKTYLIAGKTGTAQNANNHPHAWFSAYAPYNSKSPDDRIVVTVLVENTPKGGGGTIAAPIATAIIKYYFEGTSLAQTQKEMGRIDLFNIKVNNNENQNDNKKKDLLNNSLNKKYLKNTTNKPKPKYIKPKRIKKYRLKNIKKKTKHKKNKTLATKQNQKTNTKNEKNKIAKDS